MNPKKFFLASLLFAGSVFVFTSSSEADLIYSENFDSAPATVAQDGHTFGGAAPDLTVGEFAIATDLNIYDFSNNDLRYTGQLSTRNRGRSIGSVIDISGSSIGSYEFSFDVSLFNIPNSTPNDQVNVSIYEISGISATEAISIDVRKNNVDFDPDLSTLGAASVNRVVGPQEITGIGSITIPFTVSSTGNVGDYIFFAFTSTSDNTEDISEGLPEFGIDNIALNSVPEPSSLLLMFGATTLGLVARRRRRARHV